MNASPLTSSHIVHVLHALFVGGLCAGVVLHPNLAILAPARHNSALKLKHGLISVTFEQKVPMQTEQLVLGGNRSVRRTRTWDCSSISAAATRGHR